MKRYLISFSYDATNYYGYQKQPNLHTIQQVMEETLQKINNNHKVTLHATSRTDRGVHALNQKAHADLEIDITCYKLKRAMNSNLPSDIHVNDVNEVAKDFHVRYLAKAKEYVYTLNMGEYNPLERNIVYQYGKKLDVSKMSEALTFLEGTHDFTSFVCTEDLKENSIRTIFKTSITEQDDKLFISFFGDGFLKYQIRNMVGTLIEVGNGKRRPDDIKNILLAKDRREAGKTARPEGLCLKDVIL